MDIQIKARTFDIKTKFSDTNSPAQYCTKLRLCATACKMGIHNGSIVVYDTKNLFSPRAWWLLRSWDMRRFGYSMAAAWIKEGYATEKKTGTIYEKVILLQISNRSCLKLKNRF
jgi:3-mercaptopyruvate sulfurtransferase SseA